MGPGTVADVLHQYGWELSSRRGMTRCPFHEDKHPSFSYRDTVWHCFSCGESGNAWRLRERLGLVPARRPRRPWTGPLRAFQVENDPYPSPRRLRPTERLLGLVMDVLGAELDRLGACLREAAFLLRAGDELWRIPGAEDIAAETVWAGMERIERLEPIANAGEVRWGRLADAGSYGSRTSRA